MFTFVTRLFAPAVLLSLAAGAAHAATPCPGVANCLATPKFTVTLADFRTGQDRNSRRATLTLRFANLSDAPLALGYVDGSAVALDDLGNRYELRNKRDGLKGLGIVTPREFDPKFTLAPGERADARIELGWHAGSAIVGTVFDVDLALREIDPQPGGQLRLGREHSVGFRALRDGLPDAGAAPNAPNAPATSATAAPGTAADATPVQAADPCAGIPQCSANGPLVAHVVRIAPEAPRGNNQGIVVTVRFRNTSAAPLILNYKTDSGSMLDELGQRYVVDSRSRESVQGIPVSTRSRASSDFTLRPGEHRDARFRYTRYVGRSQLGTEYSPDLAIEQYELLPSNQLRLVREYALSFSGLRAGALDSATPADGVRELEKVLRGVGDLFRRD